MAEEGQIIHATGSAEVSAGIRMSYVCELSFSSALEEKAGWIG